MALVIAGRVSRGLLKVPQRARPTVAWLPQRHIAKQHDSIPFPRCFSQQSASQEAASEPSSHPGKCSSSGELPRRAAPLLFAAGALLAGLLSTTQLATANADVNTKEVTSSEWVLGSNGEQLPHFRLSEVREHGPKSDRPWIVYEDTIYDITDWVPAHPGGEVILRAAGGSIEPYWDIFSIHKSQYVREILDQFAIGKLHPDDLVDGRRDQIEDPFVSDPARDERMRFLTDRPCNAETQGGELAASFITPNEVFYVRNHMWVPVVEDPDDYEVGIELPSGDVKTYTVRDLRARFKQHAVTAVLQCSGNRRKDMTDQANKTNGLQWTVGAIGCAKWEGVRLRDVLVDAGLPADEDAGEDARHVQFSGLEAYGASIPMASALDPRGDVLLALRMNDAPLPRDHGFPVRVVVPGHVAARAVKWLKKIVVSGEESNTSWQRRDYKCFGPNETKQDWDKYKSIQKMPVTSAITRTRLKPEAEVLPGQPSSSSGSEANADGGSGSTLAPKGEDGRAVEIEGYAYSGGGHEIQRVDISLDGGRTWDQARLLQNEAKLEKGSRPWCWKRWTYEGLLPAGDVDGAADDVAGDERRTTIVVKATDDTYNTQPETQKGIYNLRGNLATAWHRVDCVYGRGGDEENGR